MRRQDRPAGAANVPVGYYKDPEKSAETFIEIDGERYSVPGDYARIEEDGTVTLLGRGSNCINTGGEKVYPEEVEGALKGHPDVYDALVVGCPDEKYGQAVAAVVQPRRRDPRARGAGRVPAHRPVRLQAAARSLTFVDEMPRNATGKAQYPWAKERSAALADPSPERGPGRAT